MWENSSHPTAPTGFPRYCFYGVVEREGLLVTVCLYSDSVDVSCLLLNCSSDIHPSDASRPGGGPSFSLEVAAGAELGVDPRHGRKKNNMG